MYIISNIFTFVSHNFHQFVSNAGDAGLYQIQNGSTFCLPCLTGTFQNVTGSSSCQDCPIGFSNGDTKKKSCTRCKEGRFQDAIQAASCEGIFILFVQRESDFGILEFD
tara:strand:- start:132 stop:458 length:327 start_codon:yes stop_codon:yes gene_type:complete